VSLEHLEDDELCEALEALLQPLLPSSHTHMSTNLNSQLLSVLILSRIRIFISTLEAVEIE
jgi:hypothetical protein